MKKVVIVLAIFLVFGLVFAACATTQNKGIYEGVSVWLVSETNMAKWKSGNYNGQATPTAIGSLSGSIADLQSTFSVQFKEPYDYGNGKGWWNENQNDTNWTAASGDYYVLLVPKYWSSGVSGKGNMSWDFDTGKASATGGNLKKIPVSNTRQSFSLADFQNVSEISY